MKQSSPGRSTRASEIEKLYRTAGTPITREQAEGLADREEAERAVDLLRSQRVGDFLPEDTQPA